MVDISEQRKDLHARLERFAADRRSHLQAEIDNLNQDLERGHEWINSAPDSVIIALIHTGAVPMGSYSVTTRDRDRVPLYEPIREIVESFDPEILVTSVIIHDALLQQIPALEFEDQRKLKARIASTLSRLADENILEMARPGSGSTPHKYKIVVSPLKPLVEILEYYKNKNMEG